MKEFEFLSLFNECIDKNLHNVFSSAVITDIQASLETRTVKMNVRMPDYVNESDIQKAKAQIKTFMSLNKLVFEYYYNEDMFCDKWIPFLVNSLNTEFSAGRTFLDGAVYTIDGNKLTVTLRRNGKDVLKQLGVEEYIAKSAGSHFGKKLVVEIVSSNANAAEEEEKELLEIQKKEMPKAAPSPEKSKTEKKPHLL